MKQLTQLLFVVRGTMLAGLITGVAALAQAPATPGPEHAELKKLEGTWKATVSGMGNESTGTSTYKMECGGLWLVSTFQGDFGGQKFEGRGLDTYDAAKKKYISVWVDSMITQPMIFEGTMNKETKKLTMTADGTGQDGKPAKFKSVTHFENDDHQTFTMFMVDPDGKENEMMTIKYERKK